MTGWCARERAHHRARWVLGLMTVTVFASLPTPVVAAMSYSITLTANPTTLEVGQYTTLTMTANKSLTGSRYSMYLYDQTDPTWMRTCSGQTCSFQAAQFNPGSHTYIAYIARTRADPGYPPRQTIATSSPVTVTWTPVVYTISLEADRRWLPPGSTSTLRATTNRDVGGTAFAIQIYDLTANQRIASCSTGATCSTVVAQFSLTTHTYQAFVAPPSASAPPPNSQASSDVVSITWSPLPDPSRPPNIGGGDVSGTVSFSEAVPPSNAPCAATHFTFDGMSASAWLNGSVTFFVGPLTVSGEGGSACENATSGSGNLTVHVNGNGPGGRLECLILTGTFARVGTDVIIVVTGNCEINGREAFRVTFQARGEFLPVNPGEGIIVPVTKAAFAGGFVVVPA